MRNILLKISLIFLIALLLFVILYVIVNKNDKVNDFNDDVHKEENENIFEMANSETKFFDTHGSEKLFTVGKIENITYENKEYTKIELTFNNKTDIDARMDQYLFQLVDSNYMILDFCYTDAYGDLHFNDIFPKIATSKNVTYGNLYCLYSDDDAKYLMVSYIIDPIFNGNEDDIKYESHYIEIKHD